MNTILLLQGIFTPNVLSIGLNSSSLLISISLFLVNKNLTIFPKQRQMAIVSLNMLSHIGKHVISYGFLYLSYDSEIGGLQSTWGPGNIALPLMRRYPAPKTVIVL